MDDNSEDEESEVDAEGGSKDENSCSDTGSATDIMKELMEEHHKLMIECMVLEIVAFEAS